jgi:hypothetical protein
LNPSSRGDVVVLQDAHENVIHVRRTVVGDGRAVIADAEAQEVVPNRFVAADPAAVDEVGYHTPGLVTIQASFHEPAQILGARMFFHATPLS